jgi:hypothetical protein
MFMAFRKKIYGILVPGGGAGEALGEVQAGEVGPTEELK